MTINFYDLNHIKSPFSYSVDLINENKTQQINRQLSLSQKITAIAVFILFSPLFFVGGYLAFLGTTAAFKNKNIRIWNAASHLKRENPKTTTSQDQLKVANEKIPELKLASNSCALKDNTPQVAVEKTDAEKIKINYPVVVGGNKAPLEIFVPALPKRFSDQRESSKKITEDLEIQKPIAVQSSGNTCNALLGQRIPFEIASQKVSLLDRNFGPDEFDIDQIVLVLRSDALYQYVKFKGIKPGTNNGVFDAGDGIISEKAITTFYKLKNPLH